MSPTDEEIVAEWRADPVAAQKRWIAEEVERIREARVRLGELSDMLFQNKPNGNDNANDR